MMKRTLTIMLLLVAITAGTQAQSYKSAIGLRGGDPFGVTFKTFVSSINALELIVRVGLLGK
ncbi:MAG: hypothetical protein U5L72_05175 [Bacteroidales bacterium]|nr:hypothetical protein [Bacteroidales bacterium]